MKLLVLAIALLSGCAMHPPAPPPPITVYAVLPKETVEDKPIVNANGILSNQTVPPKPSAYKNIEGDNIAFYKYVNDFNWYLNYLFSYVSVLNDYAVTRGWSHPRQVPLCRMIEWDGLETLPKFVSTADPSNSLGAFEWELVEYIKTIKSLYSDQADRVDTVQRAQRLLCVF